MTHRRAEKAVAWHEHLGHPFVERMVEAACGPLQCVTGALWCVLDKLCSRRVVGWFRSVGRVHGIPAVAQLTGTVSTGLAS
jgi:hypothetical protein